MPRVRHQVVVGGQPGEAEPEGYQFVPVEAGGVPGAGEKRLLFEDWCAFARRWLFVK